MNKFSKFYIIATAINILLMLGEVISFAVWVAIAKKYDAARDVYYLSAIPIVLLIVTIVAMFVNRKINLRGKIADSNTLHWAVFTVNVVDIVMTNVFFALVMGMTKIKVEQSVNLILVGVFFLVDIIFFLMSKGFANGLNHYYAEMENEKQLNKKVGLIAGISLAISNLVMLILAICAPSIIMSFVILTVNLISVFVSMSIAVKKYGKKKYL